jgi:hypothetical protein
VTEEQRFTIDEFHRGTAARLFNHVWTLLENDHRTPDQDAEMLHAAHASVFHWSRATAGTPKQQATGEWQLARAYATLGMAESALFHARRGLAVAQENGMPPFNVGFAWEGVGRALLLSGDHDGAAAAVDRARALAADVTDEEDRRWLEGNLDTVLEGRFPKWDEIMKDHH